jgi:hypothetical protein
MLCEELSNAPNKRINTRFARGGQIHVGSPRFARYFSLRIFARYAGRYTLIDLKDSDD